MRQVPPRAAWRSRTAPCPTTLRERRHPPGSARGDGASWCQCPLARPRCAPRCAPVAHAPHVPGVVAFLRRARGRQSLAGFRVPSRSRCEQHRRQEASVIPGRRRGGRASRLPRTAWAGLCDSRPSRSGGGSRGQAGVGQGSLCPQRRGEGLEKFQEALVTHWHIWEVGCVVHTRSVPGLSSRKPGCDGFLGCPRRAWIRVGGLPTTARRGSRPRRGRG